MIAVLRGGRRAGLVASLTLAATLAGAASGCSKAKAEGADAAVAAPTVTVEYLQAPRADSARVIARWARPCDPKGCADGFRVQWTAGATALLRNTAALADTLMLARPPVGDSIVATVAVTAVRRGLPSSTRSTMTVVRNPDLPPPPVDSLRTDTLSYEAALRDTFPVDVVRDSLGQKVVALYLRVGESPTLCTLSRSRYTGEVRIMLPSEAPPEADAYLAAHCEVARQLFAFERDG